MTTKILCAERGGQWIARAVRVETGDLLLVVFDLNPDQSIEIVAHRADWRAHPPMSRLCINSIEAPNPTNTITNMIARPVRSIPLVSGSP